MKPFVLTEEDYVSAGNLHLKRWDCTVLVLLSVSLLLLLAWYWEGRDAEALLWIMGIFTAVALGAFFAGRNWRGERYRKSFRERRALHNECHVSFNAEAVEWRMENGHYRGTWPEYLRFREGASLLLLYEARQLMRIVPERAFDDAEERARFVALASRIPLPFEPKNAAP